MRLTTLRDDSHDAKPQPAPPTTRQQRVDTVAFLGFRAAILVSLLMAVGFAALSNRHPWVAVGTAACSVLLLAEGALLATDWCAVRKRTAVSLRLRRRRDRPQALATRLAATLVDLSLQLLGVIWIGAGIFLASTALITLT